MGVLIMGAANFLIPFIVFGLTDHMDSNNFRIRERATHNLNTISQIYDIRAQLLFIMRNTSIPCETRLRCRKAYETSLIKNFGKVLQRYGNVKIRDKSGKIQFVTLWTVSGTTKEVYLYDDAIKLGGTVYIANSFMPINFLLLKHSSSFDNPNTIHAYMPYRMVRCCHRELLIKDFVMINHQQTIPQLVDHILRFASRDKQ
jgi:hypothetical protein